MLAFAGKTFLLPTEVVTQQGVVSKGKKITKTVSIANGA